MWICSKAVLRIHDILVWIRFRNRILWLMDPDPDSDPAIFVIDLQEVNKKKFVKKNFSLLLFEGTLTSFSKDKKSKIITK